MLRAQGLEPLTFPRALVYSHAWILHSALFLITFPCFYYYPCILVQFFVPADKNLEISVDVLWTLIHVHNGQPPLSQEHGGQTVASARHHQNTHTWDLTWP